MIYERLLVDIANIAQEYSISGISFALRNDDDVMMNVMVPKFSADGYMGHVDSKDPINLIMTKGL